MLNFDYQKTYDLCKAFAKMSRKEREVFDFLWKETFEGNYTDLAKALGEPKGYECNVRKIVKRLEEQGLVCVVYNKTKDEEKFDKAFESLMNKGIDVDEAEKILQELGYTMYGEDYPENEPKHRTVKAIFIVDGWMDILLNER